MGNEDDRAGEVRQGIGEHIDRSRIEVVRRLVEQQGIGRLNQHPGECNTIAFPSAQGLDRLLLIVTGKEEGAGQSAKEIRFRRAGDFSQGFQDRVFGVQRFGLVLGKVVKANAVADGARPCVGRQDTGQHF